MLTAINAALAAISSAGINLTAPKGAGRAFELLILSYIARELASPALGWTVQLCHGDGNPIPPGGSFIVRGGKPTGLKSGAAYGSFVSIRKGNRAWEIWNGIQFLGRSNAKHEIDIAVVPAALGTILRGNGKLENWPFGRPLVSIECKDVATSGSPDEMRTFVARLYDLTILDAHLPHLNSRVSGSTRWIRGLAVDSLTAATTNLPGCSSYYQTNRDTLNILARRSGFDAGALDMTAYFAINPRDSVTAISPHLYNLAVEVATWIDNNG